jgi:hypothetical protein
MRKPDPEKPTPRVSVRAASARPLLLAGAAAVTGPLEVNMLAMYQYCVTDVKCNKWSALMV